MPPQVADTSWGFSPVLLALNADYDDEHDGDLAFLTDGAGDDRVATNLSLNKPQESSTFRLGDFSRVWGDIRLSDVPPASSSSASPATPPLDDLSPIDSDATIAPENTSDVDDVFSYPPLKPTNQHPLADKHDPHVHQKLLSADVNIVDQNTYESPTCASNPAVLQLPSAKRAGESDLDQAPDPEQAKNPEKKKKKNRKERRKAKRAAQEAQNTQSEIELLASGPHASKVTDATPDLAMTSVQEPRQQSPSRKREPHVQPQAVPPLTDSLTRAYPFLSPSLVQILCQPSQPVAQGQAIQATANVTTQALSTSPPKPVQILRRPSRSLTQPQLQSLDPTKALPAMKAVPDTPVRPTLTQQLHSGFNPSQTPPSNRSAVANLQASLQDQYTRVSALDQKSSYNTASQYGPTTPHNSATPHGPGPTVGYFVSPQIAAPQPAHIQASHVASSRATQFTPVTPVPAGASFSFHVRSREDRHFDLLKKLIELFPEDKRSLVAPMQLCNNGVAAEGVHVFVDASNILIGFKEKLKELGVRPTDMAFDCLALIMERRRPVGRRFLAGSSRATAPLPHMERFINTVKAMGYEHHIFEKVQKRKEPTAGQKFFQDVRRMGWQEAQQRRSGEGSGSETDTGLSMQPALKWVEQGVDEILHLGMLQSVLDAEEPGIMVLATGDGQQAEFSDGFPAHVERALRKGWRVELVSWKQQTSAAYRKMLVAGKWGDRFQILYLDELVEFLVDN